MTRIIALFFLLASCGKLESSTLDSRILMEVSQDSTDRGKIIELALANGFSVRVDVIDAITTACRAYGVDVVQLTAIGIIESGLGKYARDTKNTNGTTDRGVFQINTVNIHKCAEFRLDTIQGNAFCAAKILSKIKITNSEDIGKYHSKTPSKKLVYYKKIKRVISSMEK